MKGTKWTYHKTVKYQTKLLQEERKMALYIDVPFKEKDEAKELGARWDAKNKKWCVENKKDYPKFQKWILPLDEDECMVLCDHFYIVEGVHTCFKCKKPTRVIGFGLENFYVFYKDGVYGDNPEPEYSSGEIHIASSLEPVNPAILGYLRERYNYYYGYSKFTNSNYYGNHCNNCGVLQGNFHLFEEVDTPFCVDSIEAAKALKLFRVKLPFDIKVSSEVGFGSEDYLIKEYADIIDFKMP